MSQHRIGSLKVALKKLTFLLSKGTIIAEINLHLLFLILINDSYEKNVLSRSQSCIYL